MLSFHAYMLRCADGSYYVGHTDDLDARMADHMAGEIPGYTSARRPVVLVWCEATPSRDQAFDIEQMLKGWSRRKKEALIRGDWDTIRALAKGRHRQDRV